MSHFFPLRLKIQKPCRPGLILSSLKDNSFFLSVRDPDDCVQNVTGHRNNSMSKDILLFRHTVCTEIYFMKIISFIISKSHRLFFSCPTEYILIFNTLTHFL